MNNKDARGLKKITETTNNTKVAGKLMLLTPVVQEGGFVFGNCAVKPFGRNAKVGFTRLLTHAPCSHTKV